MLLNNYRKNRHDSATHPILHIRDARLQFGERILWHDLNVDVWPGEFIAVLGPNGSGKTSLLKVLLGQNHLAAGTVKVCGHNVRVGDSDLGYVPQQKGVDPATPLRARDIVSLGIDGHIWGFRLRPGHLDKRVDDLLKSVGATEYADAPVGTLSGGELQRLRLAQALASKPKMLLCDEPLLSLDIPHQHLVAALLDKERRENDTAILFVTHEVNPILPYVDRIIYIVGGHFLVGTPDEVLNSKALSALFNTKVEVVRVGGRMVVIGGDTGHHPLPSEESDH